MRIIDCVQGTPEWIAARLGIPTASQFHRIITPTGKPSAQQDRYLAELVAEWILGEPVVGAGRTGYMERGTELEPEAIAKYEWDYDVEVCPVGFCVRDDGRAGASPDGLVGDDGAIEVKCKGAAEHMLAVIEGVTNDHRVQLQGQLLVLGRPWVDLWVYNPSLPCLRVRVERDEKFIALLSRELDAFVERLDETKTRFAEHRARYLATKPQPTPVDPDPFCAGPDDGARPNLNPV